jgi:hypothetical protein
MLFDTGRHEPLRDSAWNAQKAKATIAAIVEDVEAEAGPQARSWPGHPLDDVAHDPPQKTLYLGASGILWALWYLEREGAVTLSTKPADLIEGVYREYLLDPDTRQVVPSYFLGEVGILLVVWRLTGSREAAARLHDAIFENIPNPANEALWAAPGTMIGALHMLGWTNEPRWEALFAANVEQLWRTWRPSEHAPCHLWTQDLYGEIVQLLGAGHGFAGNAFPLLRGAKLLAPDRRAALYARCIETLRATAIVEGDGANWPPGVGNPRHGRGKVLVQWCHGAPGIVTSFASFPPGLSAEMDELLVKAGHTTWEAGALEKGFGLCHGTAGNGYAFLALHQRTGDPMWLERARAFAMHAIGQYEAMRNAYGQGRYSLWTGDPGLAVYLWHCVKGAGSMPSLDLLG